MKNLPTLLFACTAFIASFFSTPVMAGEPLQDSIDIEHPWSRPTPPGTPMGVGYMVIRNQSDENVTLVGASTPRAGHVSIHETLMKDGVMRMQPVRKGLPIPAGNMVELKPHSYHLMLEKLTEPLKEGESIPLTLTFDGAEPVVIELQVQSLDSDMEAMEMDHSGHTEGH